MKSFVSSSKQKQNPENQFEVRNKKVEKTLIFVVKWSIDSAQTFYLYFLLKNNRL